MPIKVNKNFRECEKFAKITLGAERGSFFILDKDSDEMVAHLFDEDCDTTESNPSKKVRFSKERGIAGLVAKTGRTVNISDAYKDSRFNKEIDQKTGFITRSILCMPIVGASGVLGVVQVVNKKNGGGFTKADETLFKTFSLYCSLAMHYTDVHSQIIRQKHLNVINMRAVKLQQVPCMHDVSHFFDEPQVEMPMQFDSWYIAHTDEMAVAPQYALYMITQLVDVREIDIKCLMIFILTARKFYRDIPYHNFEHAFNVCHCMYLMLKRNLQKFSKLEVKALLIACLCHDIDHVGYTNSFLHLTQHDLAMLYDSSIMENHHVYMTLMLLNDYPIFKGFNDLTRSFFLNEIEKAIIATDLALYFECRSTLLNIINSKIFTWSNKAHRTSVKSIMMNACDLSGNCKPFLAAKKITDNLYREFYRQGDLEKEMGSCPLSVMDRDQANQIPEDQIRFLNVIVIPCVDTLRIVLPNTKDLYLGALMLRSTWQDIVDARGKKVWRQDDSIVSTYL